MRWLGLGAFTLMMGIAAYSYQQELGTWESRAPLQVPRGEVAVAEVSGKIYVTGGFDGVYSQNEVYNPKTNSWGSQPPMPRHGIAAAVLNDKIHIPGGGTVQGFSISSAHEVYQPTKTCE